MQTANWLDNILSFPRTKCHALLKEDFGFDMSVGKVQIDSAHKPWPEDVPSRLFCCRSAFGHFVSSSIGIHWRNQVLVMSRAWNRKGGPCELNILQDAAANKYMFSKPVRPGHHARYSLADFFVLSGTEERRNDYSRCALHIRFAPCFCTKRQFSPGLPRYCTGVTCDAEGCLVGFRLGRLEDRPMCVNFDMLSL